MCGRFTLRTPMHQVADAFAVTHWESEPASFVARFNIAPTQLVAAIRARADGPGRSLTQLQWGLIPSWADDPAIGSGMINARSESVATKPAFREAFRRRRCLIPADGFYEWRKNERPKQPYFIHLRDELPFAFAGLWEHWNHGELTIDSCTVVTTTANDLLRPLHERMPVILDRAGCEQWLDPALDDEARLQSLLTPYPSEQMAFYAVSTKVNSARCDEPVCIEAAAPLPRQGTLFD